MKFGKKEIIPIAELSGETYGFQSDNLIFVSEAIYVLLQDPQVSDVMMNQVRVVKLNDIIELELEQIVSAKGLQPVLDRQTKAGRTPL